MGEKKRARKNGRRKKGEGKIKLIFPSPAFSRPSFSSSPIFSNPPFIQKS